MAIALETGGVRSIVLITMLLRGRGLLAIGEAKWGERLGASHLNRLDRARTLLRTRPGLDASSTHIVLASGVGFSDDLRRAATDRDDLVLVDPHRLYQGD